MTGPVGGPAGAAPPPRPEHERLRQAARDLEGVFVEQMFKAMRETVPEGGVVSGGSGEEMFSTLLDQRLSAAVPGGWERGLSAALYRDLAGAQGTPAAQAGGPPAGTRDAGTRDPGGGDVLAVPGPRSPVPGPSSSSSHSVLPPILTSDTSTLPEHS